MDGRHSVVVDAQRGLLHWTLEGFFDPRSLAALKADRADALMRLKVLPRDHVTLIDISRCPIQSQEMVRQFQELLLAPHVHARKVAFIVGSSLARMQVRRLIGDLPAAECFEDVAAAKAWLFADD